MCNVRVNVYFSAADHKTNTHVMSFLQNHFFCSFFLNIKFENITSKNGKKQDTYLIHSDLDEDRYIYIINCVCTILSKPGEAIGEVLVDRIIQLLQVSESGQLSNGIINGHNWGWDSEQDTLRTSKFRMARQRPCFEAA